MKKNVSLLIIGFVAFGLFAFVPKSLVQEPWPVPDTYKNKVNPLKGNAESLVTGKTLYNQHCKSCHGTKGKGDGPKAAQLDTESGDFTKATFQAQTDGALYYKTENSESKRYLGHCKLHEDLQITFQVIFLILPKAFL